MKLTMHNIKVPNNSYYKILTTFLFKYYMIEIKKGN